MAKLTIGRGTNPNDGTGDNLLDGANKINLNFDEIYTAIGNGTTLDGTIKIADDSSTVMTLSANGESVRLLGGSGITSTISLSINSLTPYILECLSPTAIGISTALDTLASASRSSGATGSS